MIGKKGWILLLLLVSIVLINCKSNQVEYGQIQGEWKTVTAKRNGRPTLTLENVIFSFSPEHQMSTNIFGVNESFDIEYSFPEITVTGSKMTSLNVLALKGDTLVISSRIFDHTYDFNLVRADLK